MTAPSLYSDHWRTPSPFRDGFRLKDRPLRVLSLGAGVQSTTLLLMSIRGELPKLDAAIFADTQWEPKAVYEHLGWLASLAGQHEIPVLQVTRGNLRETALELARNEQRREGERYASIPLHILMPDGTAAINRRQCTHGYKVMPVEKCIRQTVLGLQPGERVPEGVHVEQWFGITWDERQRVRTCQDKWRTFVYPFCGIPSPINSRWVQPNGLPRLFRREDCIRWLKENYPDREVPRSACIGCPYRNNQEWRAIRDDAESWADAVAFDRAIRQTPISPDPERAELRGTPYLYRKMIPLEEVDLRSDEELGQGALFGVSEDCEGMCGV